MKFQYIFLFILCLSTSFVSAQNVYAGIEAGGVGLTASSSIVNDPDNRGNITGEGFLYGIVAEFVTSPQDQTAPGLYASMGLSLSKTFITNGGSCAMPDQELNCYNVSNRIVFGRLGIGFTTQKSLFAGYFVTSVNNPRAEDDMLPLMFTFGFGGTIHYEIVPRVSVIARAELGVGTINQTGVSASDNLGSPFQGIGSLGVVYKL